MLTDISMWLFHLNRKQITLITLLASVESSIVWHPLELAELSKRKQGLSLKTYGKLTQLLSDSRSRLDLKAIVQVEVNDTQPTYYQPTYLLYMQLALPRLYRFTSHGPRVK